MVTKRKKLKLIHKTQGAENISMGNHQCVNVGRQRGKETRDIINESEDKQ